MKKLLFLAIFLSQIVYSQSNVTFYFIFNDSKLTKEDIRRKINFIIENSESKKTKFEIVHYTRESETISTWDLNKSTVNYKPTKIGCEFELCTNLSAILSYTKTEASNLFLTENSLSCDFGVKTIQLPNKDESTIIDKLNGEIERLKKTKSVQTTYFVFNSVYAVSKPSLKFEPDKIVVKQSEVIRLSPIITGDFVDFNWTPVSGLSCSNCINPEVSVFASTKYTLTAKDSSGCNAISATIDVEVEKNCDCTKGIEKVEIQFGKLPIKKYERKTVGTTTDWEWKVLSNQSGDYVFDFVTNANCAKKFRLRVLRFNGDVLFDEYYSREEVDKRSRNPYHEKYPDNFVFKVNFSDNNAISYIDYYSEEQYLTPYFIVEITTIDENGDECLSKQYKSPKLRLTKCN